MGSQAMRPMNPIKPENCGEVLDRLSPAQVLMARNGQWEPASIGSYARTIF